MAERQNRNVRHLPYRDAELIRTEVTHHTVDPHAGVSRRAARRHGWPLPDKSNPGQEH